MKKRYVGIFSKLAAFTRRASTSCCREKTNQRYVYVLSVILVLTYPCTQQAAGYTACPRQGEYSALLKWFLVGTYQSPLFMAPRVVQHSYANKRIVLHTPTQHDRSNMRYQY